MTIGTDTVFSDDFTRADNGSSAGASYTVQSADSVATTYGIATNRLQHMSGGTNGIYNWAKIDPALLGSENYTIRTAIEESAGAHNIGAFLRLTTAIDVPTGYFLGKFGAGACIRRFDAGVITDLVNFQYIAAWDGVPGQFFLKLDVDTVAGDVVLTVSDAASEGGSYTQRATFTDTSGSKILTAGTAAASVGANYSGTNLKTWDYFRVIGTSVGGGSNINLMAGKFGGLFAGKL